MFDTFLQAIVKMCVELVAEGCFIENRSRVAQKTVKLDNVLRPGPERFLVPIKTRIQNFVVKVIFPVRVQIIGSQLGHESGKGEHDNSGTVHCNPIPDA